MFLLIRRSGAFCLLSCPLFTFHYVSTYTNLLKRVICDDLNLHSTMFLLIPVFPAGEASAFSIYIPLCFYLYGGAHRQQCGANQFTFHYVSTYTILEICLKLGISHLHSTMFLLIHDAAEPDSPISNIYIPLCFYLYWDTRIDYGCMIHIYIPLCFYLYRFGN